MIGQEADIQPGDETTLANNPRNALAGYVNPALKGLLGDDTSIQIPTMTVADEKQYQANLPEQMAGSAMGSIGRVGNQAASRFGKVLMQDTRVPGKGLGTVKNVASAADNAAAKQAASMAAKKELDATGIKRLFDEKYGAEALARKGKIKKGLETMDGYDSWKQEMMNKIRRGEE